MSLLNSKNFHPDIDANGGVFQVNQVELIGQATAPTADLSSSNGRMYYDTSANTIYAYLNGSWTAWGTGGGTSHNLLSSTHTDSLAGTVVRGDVIIGNATPKWSRLAVGAANTALITDGTDVSWGTITNAMLAGSIALTKLANGTSAYIIVCNGSAVPTYVAMSGDAAISNAGLVSVTDLTITNEAAGDILYFNGSNWVRLAKDAGKFLRSDASAVSWQSITMTVAGGLTDGFTLEGGTYDPVTTITAQTTGAAALTIPDLANVAQQWVFSAVAQTLTNKTLVDSTTYIVDDGDATKKLQFQCSGITTSTTRTVTIPDASGTMTLLGNTSTGSGSVVLATTPTLVTPVLGVATATSINKVAITQPATSATLTIADGKTLTCSNSLTFSGTDAIAIALGANNITLTTAGATSVTLPTSGTLATLAGTETLTGKTLTTPTLTTPTINGANVSYAAKSGDYTLVATDFVIDFSGLSAQATATLPTAAGITGRTYMIKRSDATYNVVIDGNGAETIDGAATVTLSAQYQFRAIVSNGTNWVVISS